MGAEDKPPRGKRLPEDWKRGKSLKNWEKEKNYSSTMDLDFEEEKFKDHWLASAGQNARKTDWDAAWRNWVRKAAGEKPRGRPPQETREATRDRKARETQDLKRFLREQDDT